jgi:hypothetical protein
VIRRFSGVVVGTSGVGSQVIRGVCPAGVDELVGSLALLAASSDDPVRRRPGSGARSFLGSISERVEKNPPLCLMG